MDSSDSIGTRLSGGFELVAQGIVITALQPSFLSLTLARLYEVLKAPGPLCRRLTAFGATAIALHPQLIFALT